MTKRVWKIKYFVAGEWMYHVYESATPISGPDALFAWWKWIKSDPVVLANGGTMIMQTADISAAEVIP